MTVPFPGPPHSMGYGANGVTGGHGIRLVGELAKSLPSRLGPEPAGLEFDRVFGMPGPMLHVPSLPSLVDFPDPFDDLVLQVCLLRLRY